MRGLLTFMRAFLSNVRGPSAYEISAGSPSTARLQYTAVSYLLSFCSSPLSILLWKPLYNRRFLVVTKSLFGKLSCIYVAMKVLCFLILYETSKLLLQNNLRLSFFICIRANYIESASNI